MNTAKYIDKVHGITDQLERKAQERKNIEIMKQEAYYNGYVQACEDFGKWMRAELPMMLKEVKEAED